MTRRLSYISLSLVAFSVALLWGDGLTNFVQSQTSIPSVVEPCIDQDSFFAQGGAELIARAEVEGNEYYLVHTYEQGDDDREFPSAQLIAVEGGSCTTELWNNPNDYLPYAQYVPDAAAVEFRFVEARISLQRLGRQEFMNAFTSPDDLDLFPEFIRAYERLGVLEDIRQRVGAS